MESNKINGNNLTGTATQLSFFSEIEIAPVSIEDIVVAFTDRDTSSNLLMIMIRIKVVAVFKEACLRLRSKSVIESLRRSERSSER